ncbi:hypothetical protein [Streptomyces sp. VRA16 Mangrove soil]|uniref:hypothetical protein n=1 Tax=Streptomyces sp. VRA16 Mangrove soil TaxID=2817434 RepID=UPI001A9E1800|nr:hypothetical protein [Streptomyces sp. VRA16 Mangrove soil]MBO1335747.1 hypothetical protein [Streptomyces sp. VRA16 Mangrove soil]
MGEKPENSKDDQGEPKEKKRLDLSVPQVAGSAVAAVVAAKLASGLGVYGTILGAGVVSALATCGGTVFQHFFRRTGEQIRDVAVTAKPKGRQVPVTAEGRPVPRTFRSDASMDATRAMVTGDRPPAPRTAPGAVPATTTWGRPVTADADATTVLPQAVTGAGGTAAGSAAESDRTQLLDTGAVADLLAGTDTEPGVDTGAGTAMGVGDDATRMLGTVGPADPDRTRLLDAGPVDEATRLLRPVGEGSGRAPADPEFADEEFTDGTVHRARVKSWKRPLIAAALVFGVTMGGITTYELVSGQSFSGDGRSTTIGDAFKGHNASSGSDTDPSTGTSPTPSDDSGTGSGNGTQNGDDPATDGNSSPTPTPSGSSDSGTGSGSDTGSDTGSGSDTGAGSGDDGSSSTPTPTPTPSQSAGAETGATGDTGAQTSGE